MIERIKNLFKHYFLTKYVNANFYMKSGNVIRVKNVSTEMRYKYNGNTITEITGWKTRSAKGLQIQSLDLSQIEAIELI